MSTSVLALSIAGFIVINLVVGLGILSLFVGGFERYFGRPKLQFLQSALGDNGLAFSFSWNEAKEPAKYEVIRLRLFNPLGNPTQIEVAKSFETTDESFVRDLDMGPAYEKFKNAQGLEKAKVEVELLSKEGVSYFEEMKGKDFLSKLNNAKKTVSDYEGESGESIGPDPKSFGIVNRDNIADTVPGKGPVVAVPTNPAFAQFFGEPGGSGSGGGAEAQENFSVKKVWIEDGCIVCNACEDIYPEVFEVIADGCLVRDGYPTDDGLKIQDAAEACPVEIIKFETA